MKTHTIEELDRIFSEDTYPYVALYTSTHKILIHYPANTMVTKGKGAWERVKKRLESKGLPDGFYIVKGKSGPGKNVTPDQFYFKRGNVDEKELVVTQLAEKPKEAEHVLTYTAAIAANKEISELKAEVNRLEREIETGNDTIEALEKDLADLETEMSDMAELAEKGGVKHGAQYLEDLAETIVPIADKWFAVRERELDQKERMLNGQGYPGASRRPPVNQGQYVQQPPPAQQPLPAQPPKPTKQDTVIFWEKMNTLLETDPEEYQKILREMQNETLNNE